MPDDPIRSLSTTIRASRLGTAAVASAAAGLIHATAVGTHGEHRQLARLFIGLAIAQVAVAVAGFLRDHRLVAGAIALVNAAAAGGWIVTRFAGIAWIDGLERAEDPGFADTVAFVLAALAVVASVATLRRPAERAAADGAQRGPLPSAAIAILVGIVTLPAMVDASTHSHAHDESADAHGHDTADDDHEHADAPHDHADADGIDGDAVGDGAADHTDHDHPATGAGDDTHAHEVADHPGGEPPATWPRPWDPAQPIDFSGVEGVTAEQQARAEQLVAVTLAELPQFADHTSLAALGYASIGDASTGFEHFINRDLIFDDTILDPSEPESLVYRVDGDARTLVSAMFIAGARPLDDPTLEEYGGPLMQWHVHDNLCWGIGDDGQPRVMTVTENHGGTCPPGTVLAGGDNPMVHVWIAPHECGPFAALEGHGAGQAAAGDGERVDQCAHGHGDQSGHGHPGDGAATEAVPYDPALPIDLGGIEGVTPQQQAFAENLVASTVRDLPQWSDPAVAEAAGFHSIGDGATGHEHYVQWDWIDDDVWLDPDRPESLVFEPQPDGSKRLVSAMYMLPTSFTLDSVPDWGGALMQWHIHDDLCYTDDPVAPQVRSVTSVGGECPPPLVKHVPAAMIHVWITPHECGPFASLEGVGAGQIGSGEQRLCDTAHGAH